MEEGEEEEEGLIITIIMEVGLQWLGWEVIGALLGHCPQEELERREMDSIWVGG